MSSGEDNRNSVCVRVSDQYPPGAMQCGGSQDGIHLYSKSQVPSTMGLPLKL